MKRPDVRWAARRGQAGASPAAPRRSAAAVKVSPGKKILMTIMVLGAMGSTVGAGTFASFNAATTNGATFDTGTLVLTDKKNTGTACYSTGGGDTDANSSSSGCEALFQSSVGTNNRPGELVTANLTLQNLGTLTGNLRGFMSSACVDDDVFGADWNPTLGTGLSTCQNTQMAIQEYTSDTFATPSTCLYGTGRSAVATGNVALAASITVTTSTDDIRITIDNKPATTITLAAATYNRTTFAAQVQTKIRAYTLGTEVVSVTADNFLRIYSTTDGLTSMVKLETIANNAYTHMGMTMAKPYTVNGGASTCSLSASAPDPMHTLGTFLSNHPTAANGLTMGTLTPNQSRYVQIRLMLPHLADNNLQGRLAQFDLSWSLLQV